MIQKCKKQVREQRTAQTQIAKHIKTITKQVLTNKNLELLIQLARGFFLFFLML